jgi:hemerythrin superfamily protein
MPNQTDAIELLLRDHRSIDRLLEQLDAVVDPAVTRRLFLRIANELAAHEAAEQEVIFPAFEAALHLAHDDTLTHRTDEHDELNELIAEMRSLEPTSFAFSKRASALLLEIKSHFASEEESVFDRMRMLFSTDELVELGARMVAVKSRALTTPVVVPSSGRT